MRDRTLHSTLEAFTADAAAQLTAETQDGAEIPFEVIDALGRPGRAPLYCYRPLTTDFIGQRLGMLSGLPTYAPAARALAGARPDHRVSRPARRVTDSGRRAPARRRRAAVAARRVFEDRSDFGFDPVRFELAYAELERALYDGRA